MVRGGVRLVFTQGSGALSPTPGGSQGLHAGELGVCARLQSSRVSKDPGGPLRGLLRPPAPKRSIRQVRRGLRAAPVTRAGGRARTPPGGHSDPAPEQEMQLAAGVSCRKCKGSRRS